VIAPTLTATEIAYENAPFSTDATIEAENARLHGIHDAGYEANYDGELIGSNPHPAGTIEYRAWEAGHMQAQQTRDEWELCNRERAQQAEWRDGMDLS
jgi:hypothetical protein